MPEQDTDEVIGFLQRRIERLDRALAEMGLLPAGVEMMLTVTPTNSVQRQSVALPQLRDLQPVLLKQLRKERKAAALALTRVLERVAA